MSMYSSCGHVSRDGACVGTSAVSVLLGACFFIAMSMSEIAAHGNFHVPLRDAVDKSVEEAAERFVMNNMRLGIPVASGKDYVCYYTGDSWVSVQRSDSSDFDMLRLSHSVPTLRDYPPLGRCFK